MTEYPFNFVSHEDEGQSPLTAKNLLSNRPFAKVDRSFQAEARRFVPGGQLETVINTAIALGEPLLVTGEPGTGKTQTAYYVAYKLGLEPVIHFQVKSDTTAGDILYHFDTVRYFHDAHLMNMVQKEPGLVKPLDKSRYVEPRALWEAFTSAGKSGAPRVLLIDEIDKAPRDFPNDLLHELDKMEFTIMETGQTISAPRHLQPLVFITSNSERRLPAPFLRRCIYHHICFNDLIVERAISKRRDEFSNLGEDFLKMAVQRFLALRGRSLRKAPATGELLVWLRMLSLVAGTTPEKLDEDLSKLPYPGILLKDHNDLEELKGN